MIESLKSCPFCGVGETVIVPNTYWTGTRTEILTYELKHWCEVKEPGVRVLYISIRAKTEELLASQWNRRM